MDGINIPVNKTKPVRMPRVITMLMVHTPNLGYLEYP
jgi:hypothetical protein